MLSARHEQLIDELEATATRTYLEEVLLACLLPLRDGGPTSWDEVTVHDAWVTDGYLAIIYTSPWGPKVGVVHTEDSLNREKPAVAGWDLANFSIAEPLGSAADHLRYDAEGLGWSGDLPAVEGFPSKPALDG